MREWWHYAGATGSAGRWLERERHPVSHKCGARTWLNKRAYQRCHDRRPSAIDECLGRQDMGSRSIGILEALKETSSRQQADQSAQEQQRLDVWTQSLDGVATSLKQEWQQVGLDLPGAAAVCLGHVGRHRAGTAAGHEMATSQRYEMKWPV